MHGGTKLREIGMLERLEGAEALLGLVLQKLVEEIKTSAIEPVASIGGIIEDCDKQQQRGKKKNRKDHIAHTAAPP